MMIPTAPALLMTEGDAVAFAVIVGLSIYVYAAICFQHIAKKTGTPNTWWAWVPILNFLLLLRVAQKPLWWFLLALIPLVNVVIVILVWIGVCRARGKSPWLVVGLIIPLVNLVIWGYLAFSD